MPRITKAMLEEENAGLKQQIQTLVRERNSLLEVNKLLREHTPLGIISDLAKLVRTTSWAHRPNKNAF